MIIRSIKLKLRVLAFLFFIFPQYVFNQAINFTEIKSEKDWLNALNQAEEQNKVLFLDIYAVWCGPCKKMNNEVFSDPFVAGYYNKNFINAKVDGESQFGTILAREFGLKGYPSMYYIDHSKFAYSVLVGFRPSENFLDYGKMIDSVKNDLKNYAESFEAGTLNNQDLKDYIKLLSNIDYKEPIIKITNAFINSMDTDVILDPDNKYLIINSPLIFESEQFQYILKNNDTLTNLWGIEDYTHFLESVFQEALARAARNEDVRLRDRLAEELIPVYFQFEPESVKYGKFLTRKLYQVSSGNWSGYITEIESYFNYEMGGNYDFLVQEVYQIIQNQYSSTELYEASSKWLKKIPEAQQTFESYYMGAIVNAFIKDFETSEKLIIAAEKIANPIQKEAMAELKEYIQNLRTEDR